MYNISFRRSADLAGPRSMREIFAEENDESAKNSTSCPLERRRRHLHAAKWAFTQQHDRFSARGIRFAPIETAGSAGENWDALFAASISMAQKRKIYFNQFRWHLFSYGLLPALTGDPARQAFDVCRKKHVYLFFQQNQESYIVENAHLLTSADFEGNLPADQSDLYLFDPQAKWTYVHTHESYCGPYFYQLP